MNNIIARTLLVPVLLICGLVGVASAQHKYVFPQFVFGGGWTSTLMVQATATPTTCTFSAQDRFLTMGNPSGNNNISGTSIPLTFGMNGWTILKTATPQSMAVSSGMAAIEADKPSGRVIQFKRGGESALAARRFSYETLHWDRVTDMRKLRQLRVTIAEGGRETFVFLMLNQLAQSGQVNAHNFQYETVALARECESFVKDSGLVPEYLQHPLPARQGAYGRSVRLGAGSLPLQEPDADRATGNHP